MLEPNKKTCYCLLNVEAVHVVALFPSVQELIPNFLLF